MVLVFAVPGRMLIIMTASEREYANLANVHSLLHMLP